MPSRLLTLAAAAMPLLFLGMALWRAAPFVDDVSPATSAGNDWLTDKFYAESVLTDGLAIPAVSGSYGALPHGFLYIYFLAGIFAVCGVNAAYVYVVQSALLGLSITLMVASFRRVLSSWAAAGLLVVLTALALVDLFNALTFRLLSENLYVVLAPLMAVLLLREPARLWSVRLGSVVLGLIVLTRPSMVLASGLMLAFLLLWPRPAWSHVLVGAGGWLLGISGAIVREFAATGVARFSLVSNTADWIPIWHLPVPEFLAALGARVAFALGWTTLMISAYRIRPHWLLLWLLALTYVVMRVRNRTPLERWEGVVGLFVLGYLGPVVLVADIASYGGRMVAVIMPLVAVVAVRALDILAARGIRALR